MASALISRRGSCAQLSRAPAARDIRGHLRDLSTVPKVHVKVMRHMKEVAKHGARSERSSLAELPKAGAPVADSEPRWSALRI